MFARYCVQKYRQTSCKGLWEVVAYESQNFASLANAIFFYVSSFVVLPIKKFLSLVLNRNMICYNTLLSNFLSIICQVVSYGRLKKIKFLALKVFVVAYERWLLTRSSKYSDLTWKLLVLWKTGH